MADEENLLIAFVRLSKSGKGMNVNINLDNVNKADVYTDKNGTNWVSATSFAPAVEEVLSGDKEVTAISQMPKTD